MKKRSKKKKNNLGYYIIILLVIGILCYFGYTKYLVKKVDISLKDDLSIEINTEAYIKDMIVNIENGEVLNGEDKIDTSKLGDVNLKVVVKNDRDKEEEYPFKVKIVDTIAPVIEAKNEITIYVGKSTDLLKDVKVSDNSLEEIKAKVIGEYDMNKAGKYNLKYEATDSSNNKGEYDFILNVIVDKNNMTFTTKKGYSGKVVNGVTYIDGVLIANKTYSLPSSYGSGLTSEVSNAFNKMKEAASQDGCNLYIGSGFRSYNTQKTLYNNYVKRDGKEKADTYSARAGHSEHQTGLAIDICDRNESACITSSFNNTKPAKWLSENGYKYGFILRYPNGKSDITGYKYESWHFRYVGVTLATKLYNNGDWITLEEYYGIDSKYD